jgi:hypothetical protein
MRSYTPRRAGKRWLEGAPDYVLDCLDNKGKTCDRYTVIFGKQFMNVGPNGECWLSLLDMSSNPFHPQGVGMSSEYRAHEIAAFRYRSSHHRVKWSDLPELVQKCAIQWAESDY